MMAADGSGRLWLQEYGGPRPEASLESREAEADKGKGGVGKGFMPHSSLRPASRLLRPRPRLSPLPPFQQERHGWVPSDSRAPDQFSPRSRAGEVMAVFCPPLALD